MRIPNLAIIHRLVLINRFVIALLCALPAPSRGDIFVIVNPANSVAAMSQKQVLDIYMGRRRAFPSGNYVLPFDHAKDSGARALFYRGLTGMSLSQVNGYWSRLMFTGQMMPPQVLADDDAMLDIVRRNPSAIGYVETQPKDKTVTVILVLKPSS